MTEYVLTSTGELTKKSPSLFDVPMSREGKAGEKKVSLDTIFFFFSNIKKKKKKKNYMMSMDRDRAFHTQGSKISTSRSSESKNYC